MISASKSKWTCCVLFDVVCFATGFVWPMCGVHTPFRDARLDFEDRQWLWERYGTAYRVAGCCCETTPCNLKLEIARRTYFKAAMGLECLPCFAKALVVPDGPKVSFKRQRPTVALKNHVKGWHPFSCSHGHYDFVCKLTPCHLI